MHIDITPLVERLVKVTLAGRLDTRGVDTIETRFLAAMVPGGRNAVVDIAALGFLASLGIRMLVSAARGLKMRQARRVLYGATPGVLQVCESDALGQAMALCADEADALSAVGAARA